MPKPHIIYIMADQLRYDMLSAYGGQQCPTPKLDILSNRCSIFDAHYTPCPLCVPARTSAWTGLYPHQHGALINGWFKNDRKYGETRPDVQVLPDILSDLDYHVVHAGVQMVRMVPEMEERCSDVQFIGPSSVGRHHKDLAERNLMLGDMTAFRDPVIDYDNGEPLISAGTAPRVAVFPLREDLFYDSVMTDKMIEVVQKHDSDKPLALFAMYWLPHPPLWAPRQYAEMIDPNQVHLPPTVGHWYGGMPVMQLANLPGQLGAHISMEQWRMAWSVYMGMVALLDKCIGRLLAALDRAGIIDDALLVFTSDHGDMLGSHRMYQKGCLYDEAARVPMLMKMPGQTSSHRVTELTNHLDLTATVLELAGTDPIRGSSGKSLKNVGNANPSSHPRRHLFASYDGNAGRAFAHRMARNATHKLIHNIGDRPEVYDMIEDPLETKNLWGRKRAAKHQKELREALNAWMAEVGDDQPMLD